MIVFLWCIYLLAAVLRLLWWLLFRIKTEIKPPVTPLYKEHATGISIVVCAHNNCVGLQKLMPLLAAQQYPLFEIIVVNDRSTDHTAFWLAEQKKEMDRLQIVTVTVTPPHWNAKKYALRQGIQHAQYPWLALTDSDCLPFSHQWLTHIAQALSLPGKDLFLGYSPYQEQPGILNHVVQTETLFTALQYMALANSGRAYMGVGRNLAYKKSFIDKHLDSFPFQNHLGGDDDLLINQLSTGRDAATSVDPESFVLTFAPSTLKAWWKQKRRHLSAGNCYRPFTKRLLGTYWLSASLFWVLFFVLLLINPREAYPLLLVHFIFFGVGTAILFPLFRIFKAGRLFPLFLFWDFLYIASSSIIGFSTFLVKNKKWS